MNVNFGLVPPLAERVRDKRLRKEAYARRAAEQMEAWVRGRDESPGRITADLPGAVRP